MNTTQINSRALPAIAHTPGPWQLDDALGIWTTCRDGERGCLLAKLTNHGRYVSPNGRLIAAAPELLEALVRVSNELADLIKDERDEPAAGIVGWNSLHQSVADARAAIAKATQP